MQIDGATSVRLVTLEVPCIASQTAVSGFPKRVCPVLDGWGRKTWQSGATEGAFLRGRRLMQGAASRQAAQCARLTQRGRRVAADKGACAVFTAPLRKAHGSLGESGGSLPRPGDEEAVGYCRTGMQVRELRTVIRGFESDCCMA